MAIQVQDELGTTLFPSKDSEKAAVSKGKSIFAITQSGRLCIPCKGRRWCGLESCPVMDRINLIAPKAEKIKREVSGPAPNLFVGHFGYPNVFAGPLVSYDDAVERENVFLYDDSSKWFGKPVNDIISFRSSFARGMQRTAVREKSRAMEDISLAVMAIRPADLEVAFTKAPTFRLSFSDTVQPMGPSERFSYLRLTSNPKIPRKIDSIISEDLQVRQALPELLEHNFGFYYVQKLLSAGILGKKDKSKMVPTRWSITAADRMIADHYLLSVREYEPSNDFAVYSSNYLDNHFEILLIPGNWEFEQFESWEAGTVWNPYRESTSISHEYEPYEGRSDYAQSEGGGYYAGRMAAAEFLFYLRKQAKVVIFREIGKGYTVPVGVWEVRENARNAFGSGARAKFSSLSDAISYLKTKLKNPFAQYISKSQILAQSRLTAYL